VQRGEASKKQQRVRKTDKERAKRASEVRLGLESLELVVDSSCRTAYHLVILVAICGAGLSWIKHAGNRVYAAVLQVLPHDTNLPNHLKPCKFRFRLLLQHVRALETVVWPLQVPRRAGLLGWRWKSEASNRTVDYSTLCLFSAM
jgi:hypothetical protein